MLEEKWDYMLLKDLPTVKAGAIKEKIKIDAAQEFWKRVNQAIDIQFLLEKSIILTSGSLSTDSINWI